MKKWKLTKVIVLLLLVGLIASISFVLLNQEDTKTFYVGVTYCGGSVEEAKELIDRVEGCTNLFVLQSGPLMGNIAAMEEIGDYAVATNLSYAVSGSMNNSGKGISNQALSNWLIEAKERWGNQFIGVYYNDEPGGKMLDGAVNFALTPKKPESAGIQFEGKSISKSDRNIHFYDGDKRVSYEYRSNGEVMVVNHNNEAEHYEVTYCPNGTITATGYTLGEDNLLYQVYTSENITQYPRPLQSYEEVLKQSPIQTYEDATKLFVNHNKNTFGAIDKEQLNNKFISVFTSDYGLYWWDYKGRYDFVLAELGWNNSITQEIGLVRGAANLQGKSWGTILTWKYTHAPYLAEGEEMYQQLKTSYETGAEYVLIFNYSEDPANPNIMQEEHFQTLERFWNEVVQNPQVTHGGIKAEAALVLPQNYGWGMRNPNDNIWGLWPADDKSQEIWNQIQSKIDQHGLKLDIVFEDSNHFVEGKYAHVYYWDQRIPTTIIALTILLIFVLTTLSIIVYKVVNKKHKINKSEP